MRGRRQDLRRKARGFASLPPRHRRRAARQAGAVPRDAPRIICADRPAVSRMRGSARHPGAGGMGKRGHGRRIAGGEAAKGICMLPSVRLLQAGGLGPWQARCKAARAAIRRPAPCASARRAARAQDDAAPRRAGSGVRGRCRGPAAPAHRLAEPPVPASRHEQPRIFRAAASANAIAPFAACSPAILRLWPIPAATDGPPKSRHGWLPASGQVRDGRAVRGFRYCGCIDDQRHEKPLADWDATSRRCA